MEMFLLLVVSLAIILVFLGAVQRQTDRQIDNDGQTDLESYNNTTNNTGLPRSDTKNALRVCAKRGRSCLGLSVCMCGDRTTGFEYFVFLFNISTPHLLLSFIVIVVIIIRQQHLNVASPLLIFPHLSSSFFRSEMCELEEVSVTAGMDLCLIV